MKRQRALSIHITSFGFQMGLVCCGSERETVIRGYRFLSGLVHCRDKSWKALKCFAVYQNTRNNEPMTNTSHESLLCVKSFSNEIETAEDTMK